MLPSEGGEHPTQRRSGRISLRGRRRRSWPALRCYALIEKELKDVFYDRPAGYTILITQLPAFPYATRAIRNMIAADEISDRGVCRGGGGGWDWNRRNFMDIQALACQRRDYRRCRHYVHRQRDRLHAIFRAPLVSTQQ